MMGRTRGKRPNRQRVAPVEVAVRGAAECIIQLDKMLTVLPASPHGVANEQAGREGNSRRGLPVK